MSQIGKEALKSPDAKHRSDACWLFAYTFDTDDDNILATICNNLTIAHLVHLLKDPDPEVQYPALKAVANMLTTETDSIIDHALGQKVIDNLMAMACQ